MSVAILPPRERLPSGPRSGRRFNAAFQQACGMQPTQIRQARWQMTDVNLLLRPTLDAGRSTRSERECVARAQAWRPWRSYAALHLWYLLGDLAKERST